MIPVVSLHPIIPVRKLFNKGYLDPKTNIRYYKYYDSTTGNLVKRGIISI